MVKPNKPEWFTDEVLREFAAKGFTEKMMFSFQRTANELDCVILTRTPGEAAYQLIDEQYDLKNFLTKSKSCDWGPMAGFLCCIPQFNKEGDAKVAFNTAELLKTVAALIATEAANKAHWDQANPTKPFPAPPPFFPPILISDKRKAWFEARQKAADGLIAWDGGAEDTTRYCYGISRNFVSDGVKLSTAMEFLIRPAGIAGLWEVRHGNVFKLGEDGSTWSVVATASWPVELQPPASTDPPVTLPPAQADGLSKMLVAAGVTPVPFLPVRGVRNVYPLYLDATDPRAYRNAVAGDFDLFAVWPLRRQVDTQRITERRFARGRPPPMFTRVPRKWLAVHPWACPAVTIELIGSGPEFDALEDHTVGNSNPLVELAAGVLNSFATAAYHEPTPGPDPVPVLKPSNKVFHSDEGGRPWISGMDLPVGVFFPAKQMKQFSPNPGRRGQMPLIIADAPLLATVVAAVLRQGEVTLHHAWLYELLKARGPTPEDSPGPVWSMLQTMFCVPLEPATAPATIFADLEARLAVLMGKPRPDVSYMLDRVEALTTTAYPSFPTFPAVPAPPAPAGQGS